MVLFPSAASGSNADKLAKSFPELWIEDRVNNRVDETVHVAQPGRYDKRSHSWLTIALELDAQRVHNVARKKWHPTNKKNT